MNETIIEFDNKKRLKLALFGLLLTIAALAFAYYIFFVAEKIRIFPGALMLTLGGLGCYCLIGGVKSLFVKDRTGLILNANGIRYNGTPVGIKAGTVKWTAIKSVSTGMAHGIHFVFLKLHHPENYLQQFSPQVQQHVLENGIAVSADQLSLDFNTLKKLIEEYYERYKGQ
ncbi:STM3941 family protein [Sphingobacterium siyangense]|jgi:hypothetical protein|uniref:STM3941 family protein n=1 Tax=Sphingobacterium siyangense TaxID=459529 RepID=UPI0028A8DF5B|nr:STM3941 family protein [Sphingobacterium siyangense]